ncbi:hypothetical protein [Intestinimonas butyriciproducens]|uniref:hypothetical protein n=1 Tax=Intestinimonas butyriciproducens TaxID=1297617 RepID=UPI00195AA065|nr:hypothetical protein [Intestinimonas butyriciproducens]MBM6974978.1 hypothetical protein [Intestinimonas butyriciproducens]
MKKVVSMLLALSAVMAMSVPAFAAEPVKQQPEVIVSTNEAGETVYTQTFTLDELIETQATESSKTVTASSTLGLVLQPGASGYSPLVDFRFTTLPTNAKVRSIEIDPGRGVINDNNINMKGSVLFTSLAVRSPEMNVVSYSWNPQGMTDNSSFYGEQARGTWTIQVSGMNLAKPVGDPLWDAMLAGSLAYKSVRMTVSYVVE